MGRVALHLVGERGTRPDHAHVPPDDVPELRQLVQGQPTQQATDAGDAGIPLVDREAGAHLLRADHHRPQLEQVELDPVLADPPLPVENWAAVLELDPERS